MLQEMKSALERLAFEDVLNVFTGNDQLPETLWAEVFAIFYQSNRSPSGEELDRAARLVAARDWHNFTRCLLKRYGLTDDLCGFFHTCADHLGFWDRARHGIGRPSKSELHDLLLKPPANFIPQARWIAIFGLEPAVIHRNSMSPGSESDNGTWPFGKSATATRCAHHL